MPEAEQIRNIDRQAERGTESEKPSVFSITDEFVDICLRQGSGFQNGKYRIQLLYSKVEDSRERVKYLKSEYGIGGWSIHFPDGSGGFADHDGKGISIRSYDHDVSRRISWTEIERRIGRLIEQDAYLDAIERGIYGQLENEYEEHGGIPLPEAQHAFSKPEQLSDQLSGSEDDTSAESQTSFAQDEGETEPDTQTSGTTEPVAPDADETEPTIEHTADHSDIIPAHNFHITDEHLGEGGPKEKFRRNIAAIRLLYQLEDEERNATEEEQQALSQYVGWGGLAEAFDPNNSSWTEEYEELRALLPERDYEMARSSVLNAHYTSPTVIRAIYDAVGQMGFRSGNILEPAMGIGNFFGMLPDEMQESRLYGIELDSVSGRIARKLYPDADITISGFEDTDRRDFYDLAIGNVPFGSYKVRDKPYDHLGFSIHNYFFAKAIDQVRPGGIIAFVTSKYTMDSQSTDVRKYIAQRAELIGAIRLGPTAGLRTIHV